MPTLIGLAGIGVIAEAYRGRRAARVVRSPGVLSFGALFAGLGVTSGATGDAVLIVAGVLLGSTTWWIALTTVVGAMRGRVTTAWIRRINVASGVVIGAFAVVAIASALAAGWPG